jgi:dipeptidyl aminopeptidase/acylaminoacyl peptidase
MKITRLLLLFLVCSPKLFAQFSIEQVLSAAFPTDLKASPVGNRVAWVFNQQGSRNIFVAEAPDFKARQITDYQGDNGQEISSLSFSPDGTSLVYVRGGANNSSGEVPNPAQLQDGVGRHIFRIDIDGKNHKKLGSGAYPRFSPKGDLVAFLSAGQVQIVPADGSKEATKLFQSRGTQGSLRWNADGSKIAFISSRNDHAFVGVYDFGTKTVRFLSPSIDLDSNPVWSLDGRELAYISVPYSRDALIFGPEREASPWSIKIVNVETGKSREIWKAQKGVGSAFFGSGLVADNSLFWTADNQIIFPYEGDGWHHFYAVPATGGAAKLLTSGNGEVEYATLSADRKSVIYNTNIGDIDRRHIWQVSAGSPAQALSTGKGIEWSPVQMTNGNVLCLRSDARTPARVAQLVVGKLQDIATETMPKDFPTAQLVDPQAVEITATDGTKIPCQLFLPSNHKANDKHPAVMFFHGGSRRQMLLGFNYGDYYHKAYALNQYMASLGYVVLSVNYRSGIGYGMEFREALNYGATGASEVNDVIGAGLYLKNRSDVDASKIGLWGGSYGGYLTAMGLVKAPELFAAGVDIHGVHDWNTTVKNFIPSYDANKRAEWAKVAYESSPIGYVNHWKAPVLLIHADDDRNVPFNETAMLADELRKHNLYFEQLVFPDDVHSFLLHQNWVSAYKATADFFDRFLRKK